MQGSAAKLRTAHPVQVALDLPAALHHREPQHAAQPRNDPRPHTLGHAPGDAGARAVPEVQRSGADGFGHRTQGRVRWRFGRDECRRPGSLPGRRAAHHSESFRACAADGFAPAVAAAPRVA